MQQVMVVCLLFICYGSAIDLWGGGQSLRGAYNYIKNITIGSGVTTTTTLKPLVVSEAGESKCLRKNFENETSSIYMSLKEDWVYFNTTIWDKLAILLPLNVTLSEDAKILSQMYVLCQPYEEGFDQDRRLAAGALASLAG